MVWIGVSVFYPLGEQRNMLDKFAWWWAIVVALNGVARGALCWYYTRKGRLHQISEPSRAVENED
jgi:hypothetical protein